jgi:hypothetical protein
VNIFGKTSKRLDAIEQQLLALALAVEQLVNRIDARVASVEQAQTSTDDLAASINEAVDRIDIEVASLDVGSIRTAERITKLDARLEALASATLDRINDLGNHLNGHITPKNETDARLMKAEARIAELATTLDARIGVINHNTTLLAEAAGLVVEPAAADAVTDLPRPPLAERDAERRARRRIRRSGVALPGVVASRSETAAVRDLPF